MPIKRRLNKSRRWRITAEAAARWRQVRPDGIYFGGGRGRSPADFVDDKELAELVGVPYLMAMRTEDMRALFDTLEETIGCR